MSVELCGGTHVGRTGDIGIISVLADSGVAAGVRRIEALAGEAARKSVNATLRSRVPRPPSCVYRSRTCRRVSVASSRSASVGARPCRDAQEARHGQGSVADPDRLRVVGDVKLMTRAVTGIDLKDLRSLADEGKKRLGSVVAIVGVTDEGKAGVVVGVTGDLTARFSAVDLVRKGAEHSAARVAAGGPTWRRLAAPTAPGPRPRLPPSRARWAEAEGRTGGRRNARRRRAG